MLAGNMITQLLRDGLDLKTDDTYITTEWRPRALAAIQKAVNEFWRAGFWTFKQGYAYLTLPGGDTQTDLPADFHKIGPHGVVHTDEPRELPYRTVKDFTREAYIDGGETGQPRIYTLPRFNPTTRRQMMGLYPTPAVGTSAYLNVYYEKQRPTIADTLVASTSRLDEIPENLHEDIIYIGALDWLLSGLSDGRAISDISPRFKSAIAMALSELQPGEEMMQQYGEKGIPDLEMW